MDAFTDDSSSTSCSVPGPGFARREKAGSEAAVGLGSGIKLNPIPPPARKVETNAASAGPNWADHKSVVSRRELTAMKRICLLVLVVLALPGLSGCARTYVITLTNGSQIVCAGKPKLEGGHYVYKDVRGEKFTVHTGRVREIAPQDMAGGEFKTGEGGGFLPK
jgi:hypothetical protein